MLSIKNIFFHTSQEDRENFVFIFCISNNLVISLGFVSTSQSQNLKKSGIIFYPQMSDFTSAL